MRKNLMQAVIVFLLSCCSLNVSETQANESKTYNEAYEAGKIAVDYINQAINLTEEEWEAIEINGLYVRLFNSITEAVRKDGEVKQYQIAEINYSDDNQYFSIRIEPTVYLIKRGDTLTKIAKEKGMTVDKLLKMNPEIVNPNLIYEGSTLRIK